MTVIPDISTIRQMNVFNLSCFVSQVSEVACSVVVELMMVDNVDDQETWGLMSGTNTTPTLLVSNSGGMLG